MTGNSPVSRRNYNHKQNSSNESSNCGKKNRKVSNGISLLSMWKIQGSQKSQESNEDDEFLPSKNFKCTPRKVKESPKTPKVSPKPSVSKASPNASIQDQGDLEYCPNCQMPFAALIKQSQNWHLTECMDFDFQHLKECPAGDSCSSTIPSHYMKYTHYGLARFRSGISQTPKISPSVKPHLSPSPEKKCEILTPPVKCQNSSNKLKVCKSTCSNISPSNNAVKTEEKCKQSTGFFSSMPQFFGKQSNNPSESSGTPSRSSTSGILAKSTGDWQEPPQEFKMPDNVPLKTLSSEKVISSKAEENFRNNALVSKQCKRVLSDMFQNNSLMGEELTCSTNNVSDSKMGSDFREARVFSGGSSDSAKGVINGMQRNIKRMKLDDSLSCTNNFLESGDGETKGSRGDLDSIVSSQSATPRRKHVDFVCSETAGGGDSNFKDSQQDISNVFKLADDWFPCDEFNIDDTCERNSDLENDCEEELFICKDASAMSRKAVVQTVITKTSGTSDNSFNITLSQVKPEKSTPQKKPKSAAHCTSSSSSDKFEPAASPRKKQTSLMSFFKSSSSHSVSTQKITFVEPISPAKSKTTQNNWPKIYEPSRTFDIEPEGQTNEVRQHRRCPFYKKIPDTTFAVDAFSYGSIPGIQHYFLSHFHYDHYRGLTKNFQHLVYCSVITANLVSLKIRLPQKYINTLKLNETVYIENVAVTILDANHCPGSVMFLFGLPDGRFMLHTGDFRATPAMELYPSLRSCYIERLFLDTTYCSPLYDFPSQDSILDMLKSLVVPRMKSNQKLLVVCGSYTIGKEKAFMAIAESIDCKIWAEPSKRSILNRLEDNRISSRLVTNESLAKIHVRPMWMIKVSYLREYLSKYRGVFNEIIGLKPTGWEHSSSASKNVFSLKPISQGPVTIYGVPYSEHSSFGELKKFVQFLKPKHITPTVNVENAQYRNQMVSHFKQWLT